MTETYLIKAADIDAMEGLAKIHFVNPAAKRINKSLGDVTGLTGLGIHIIEVEPGDETTEYHVHYFEDEAVFILSGTGTATIGDDDHSIAPGDFIGYRAGGLAHTIVNTGTELLRILVIGQRLDHDVADYPRKEQRIFRNVGMPYELVPHDAIIYPVLGAKK